MSKLAVVEVTVCACIDAGWLSDVLCSPWALCSAEEGNLSTGQAMVSRGNGLVFRSDPDLDLTRVTCDAGAFNSDGGDSCNEQVCHTPGVSLIACDSAILVARASSPVGNE